MHKLNLETRLFCCNLQHLTEAPVAVAVPAICIFCEVSMLRVVLLEELQISTASFVFSLASFTLLHSRDRISCCEESHVEHLLHHELARVLMPT